MAIYVLIGIKIPMVIAALLPVASTAHCRLGYYFWLDPKVAKDQAAGNAFCRTSLCPSKAGYTSPRRTDSRHFLAQSCSSGGVVTNFTSLQ